MSRIEAINPATATGEAKALLDAVQSGLGMVPNFLRVLAQSPAALEAFLGFHGIAGKGALDAHTRERIALSVAEQNGCNYCLSAHSAIGRRVGLDSTEILSARQGVSNDAKANAALRFASTLLRQTGSVSDADFTAIRQAGHSDAEIVEIIAHVALNLFTNILNKAADVEIDFPRAQPLTQAA